MLTPHLVMRYNGSNGKAKRRWYALGTDTLEWRMPLLMIPQDVDEYRAWWAEQRPEIPYGYCWCGCIQKTSPARQRDRKQNYFEGEPMRYKRGHGYSKPRFDSSNYEVTDTGHATPCWLWNRYLTTAGYPFLYERGTGKPQLAHRLYYEHYVGVIPEGLEIDHLCRKPACVNPEHLEPVTSATNQQRGNTAKMTPEQVREIRSLRVQGKTTGELGLIFSIDRKQVWNICNYRSWKNI